MIRLRFLLCAMLVLGIVIPHTGISGARRVLADVQIAWKIDKAQYDPAKGRQDVTRTFTPLTSDYLVEVAMSSGDAGDDLFVQLGDDQRDYTQVYSGEDRFFAVTHLHPGVAPVLHLIPDPNHDYGGRTLMYALQVIGIPSLPLSVSGVAAGRVHNILGFKVKRAGTYTIRYHLDSGTAHILVVSSAGEKDSGSVSGDGSFAVMLPAGVAALALNQLPSGGLMHWSLSIGMPPAVRDFQPKNNATLKRAPNILSVVAGPAAKLVLDGQIVGGHYDAAGGRLIYRPPRPLAPGMHLLQVVGADGTPAAKSAQFLIGPSLVQPRSSPAGSFEGQAWVRTTTPDSRYSLLKPASWQMIVSNGMVLVKNPHDKGEVILSERFLNGYVDAQQVAHRIGGALGDHLKIVKPFQYSGSKDKAIFTGAFATGGRTLVSVNLVMPELWHHALGLALGFGASDTGGSMARVLTRIESSLASNDDRAVRATYRWLQYRSMGLALQYPEGWVANFTGNGPAWFLDPGTRGMMLGMGRRFTGTVGGSALTAVGHQVQQAIESSLHRGLRIVLEDNRGGVYRWLGVYPDNDGKSQDLEVGQVAVGGGQVSALWGDTTLEQAPINIPLFEGVLDSLAKAQGLEPSPPATLSSLIIGIQQNRGVDPATYGPSGDHGPGQDGNLGAAIQLQSGVDRRNEAYLTLSNLEAQRHETFMMMMGYEYVPIYAGGF